jgi:hypothetical protein
MMVVVGVGVVVVGVVVVVVVVVGVVVVGVVVVGVVSVGGASVVAHSVVMVWPGSEHGGGAALPPGASRAAVPAPAAVSASAISRRIPVWRTATKIDGRSALRQRSAHFCLYTSLSHFHTRHEEGSK